MVSIPKITNYTEISPTPNHDYITLSLEDVGMHHSHSVPSVPSSEEERNTMVVSKDN